MNLIRTDGTDQSYKDRFFKMPLPANNIAWKFQVEKHGAPPCFLLSIWIGDSY